MNRRAYSLIELLTVLCIIVVTAAVSMPTMIQTADNAAFHQFAAQVTGHFHQARMSAQLRGLRVRLQFHRTGPVLYEIQRETNGGDWVTDTIAPRGGRSPFDFGTPEPHIAHPANGKPITDPISSSQDDYMAFSTLTSSSGTVTFSDGKGRGLSLVVNGRSGRVRAYLWDREKKEWLNYY